MLKLVCRRLADRVGLWPFLVLFPLQASGFADVLVCALVPVVGEGCAERLCAQGLVQPCWCPEPHRTFRGVQQLQTRVKSATGCN